MSRSGLFGPAVFRLLSVESGMTPAVGSSARGLDVHMYQRQRSAGPKVQRHDGAVVGPARGAVCVINKLRSYYWLLLAIIATQ
jgi:hypothetical protein